MKYLNTILLISMLVVNIGYADQIIIPSEDCSNKIIQAAWTFDTSNYLLVHYQGGDRFKEIPLYNQSLTDNNALIEFAVKDDFHLAGAICDVIATDSFCNIVSQKYNMTGDAYVGSTTLTIENFSLPANSILFARCLLPSGSSEYPGGTSELYSIKVKFSNSPTASPTVIVIPL